MKTASVCLADGRELIYYGASADWAAGYPDRRPIGRVEASSQVRYDPLLGEWVIVASHRQDRTYLPPADHCPLDPSQPGRLTEIPAPSYEVAVFENRFPSLVTDPGTAGPTEAPRSPSCPGSSRSSASRIAAGRSG